MKKNKFALFAFAIVAFVSFSFINADWVLFKKDNYKILFPGNPSTDSTISETRIGNMTVYTHMYESPENAQDSNLVYGLSVTTYPPEFAMSSDSVFLKGFFDGAINGAVKAVDGQLISQKKYSYKNYPGTEITVDYGKGTAIITMRMILVNKMVFGLQTIAFPGSEKNANAEKFFKSFDLQ